MITLNYRDPRPIYLQLKDGFRKLILSGVLQEGEKLPSVRDLASQLAINPNTIQRAYRELETEGFLYSIPGKGSFAGSPPDYAEEQRRELTQKFRGLCAELLQLGVTEEALNEMIHEEVNHHD